MNLLELIRTYFKAKITIAYFEISIQILLTVIIIAVLIGIKLRKKSLYKS